MRNDLYKMQVAVKSTNCQRNINHQFDTKGSHNFLRCFLRSTLKVFKDEASLTIALILVDVSCKMLGLDRHL